MPPRKKAPKNPEAPSQPEQAQQPVSTVDRMQAFIFYFFGIFADCLCN
jgi:hypothetical protein